MLLRYDAETIHFQEKGEILSLLPPIEGKSVLDLGAGIGRYTAEFAKLAEKVAAVDLCPHFIEANRAANCAHKNIEWLISDALDVRFPPEQFDLIFIHCILMYLPEEEIQILSKNLERWLSRNGALFIVESCAAVTHFIHTEMYYAHYRSPLDYKRLFKNWKCIKEGNIQAHEDLSADPLKCYWLYSKI